MKDVIIVSPTSGGMGGIGQHVRALADRLCSGGYRVGIISSSNTPILRVRGLMNPSFALSAPIKALGTRCRVVHAHSIPSTTAMKTVRARHRVLTIHGYYSEQVSLLHGGLLGRLVSWFEKKALRWADVVTVVSRASAEAYRRMGFDVNFIPNAVDLESLPKDGLKVVSPQVSYVGRLSKEKGLDTLLKAAAIARDLNFLIVGSGPYEEDLKSMSANLHNVRLVGQVSHDDALRYIAGSDAVVLPSYAEGLSTVILEAMALRVP
ncbi:MAG: glycosyltransferase family 4 protein, partial [Nitrososphaerota archaeon]